MSKPKLHAGPEAQLPRQLQRPFGSRRDPDSFCGSSSQSGFSGTPQNQSPQGTPSAGNPLRRKRHGRARRIPAGLSCAGEDARLAQVFLGPGFSGRVFPGQNAYAASAFVQPGRSPSSLVEASVRGFRLAEAFGFAGAPGQGLPDSQGLPGSWAYRAVLPAPAVLPALSSCWSHPVGRPALQKSRSVRESGQRIWHRPPGTPALPGRKARFP